ISISYDSVSSLLLSDALRIAFFFQAEDGIRYFHVTRVQTCALPILSLADPVHLLRVLVEDPDPRFVPELLVSLETIAAVDRRPVRKVRIDVVHPQEPRPVSRQPRGRLEIGRAHV